MEAKEYLESNDISIEAAAKAMGYTREHLSRVLSGKIPCGRKLAEEFESFSLGMVKKESLVWPNRR